MTGGGWKGPWKYKDMQLEDHYSLEIFKVSHLLDKITGLQVTSPDMKGREADIPISLKEASTLKPASEDLRVCMLMKFNTYDPGLSVLILDYQVQLIILIHFR